jgi:hypothetical protein
MEGLQPDTVQDVNHCALSRGGFSRLNQMPHSWNLPPTMITLSGDMIPALVVCSVYRRPKYELCFSMEKPFVRFSLETVFI